MKARLFVITIAGLRESLEVATRCLVSARVTGGIGETAYFNALTPKDDPEAIFREKGWPTRAFTTNKYSRPLPCMAAFCSHAALWEKAAEGNSFDWTIIAEHDCYFTSAVPPLGRNLIAVNLGRPSYGRFATPKAGFNPLTSKPHLPGAHCYAIRRSAARRFLELAKSQAEPVDVFLSRARFPFLHELYPWPAECRSTFTTIQREAGCSAKHDKVRIIEPCSSSPRADETT